MSFPRSATPGGSQTAASAAKPMIAATMPSTRPAESRPCSNACSVWVSEASAIQAKDAGTARDGEIEHPRADRHRERDDRGGRGALGHGGGRQRDRADQQAVEQMPEQQVQRLGRRQMPAEQPPHEQRRQRRHAAHEPGGRHRRELRADQDGRRVRQLHEQAQRARLLLLAERADRDERKQQGHADVEGAERGNQDTVERRQARRQHRRALRAGAGLGVQRDRLDEAVADQRTHQQQRDPQRAAADDLAQLLGEQRPQRRAQDPR